MIEEKLSTLKIHKLSQEQYNRAKEAGNLDATAFYLTPDISAGIKTANNGEIFNDYENNIATEAYSHAEGKETEASAFAAHAEGKLTIARGHCSHAEGLATVAAGPHQHVQGRANIIDEEGEYAHIVGNAKLIEGGALDKPSNAYALDWDGNANFAGDVYVGNANANKAGKKLATEEYVDTKIKEIDIPIATPTAVLYTEQKLEEEQKSQARQNINALCWDDFDDGFDTSTLTAITADISDTINADQFSLNRGDINALSVYKSGQIFIEPQNSYDIVHKQYVDNAIANAQLGGEGGTINIDNINNTSVTTKKLIAEETVSSSITGGIIACEFMFSTPCVYTSAITLQGTNPCYGDTLPESGAEGQVFYVLGDPDKEAEGYLSMTRMYIWHNGRWC